MDILGIRYGSMLLSRRFQIGFAAFCLTALLPQTLPGLFNEAIAQTQSPEISTWATLEQEIIAEQNQVRQDPQSYIPLLESWLARMDAQGNIPGGCGPRCTLRTNEGRRAVIEAIQFLRDQPSVGSLIDSEAIAQAAKRQAQDQRNGATGHIGADGSTVGQRLTQAGVNWQSVGENIDYGSRTAEAVIMSLIIDDGVANRGHRTNMFNPRWTAAGAGCGEHAVYQTVCVINYAQTSDRAANGDNLSSIPAPASDNQFLVINRGTVDLLSLKIAGIDALASTLAPGQTQTISLDANAACQANLTIQLGGNYLPLNWGNVPICGSVLTVNQDNQFNLQYR